MPPNFCSREVWGWKYSREYLKRGHTQETLFCGPFLETAGGPLGSRAQGDFDPHVYT